MSEQIYDVIIIGGGASGLFTACNLDENLKVLIIEKNSSLGKKLLLTGSGQCNITNNTDIKDFIKHYNSKVVRKILFGFTNEELKNFFIKNGVEIFVREDGKIFPKSMDSHDVLNIMIKIIRQNNHKIVLSQEVINIEKRSDMFILQTKSKTYYSRQVVMATGGCSYPGTGSDGKGFEILRRLNIKIKPTKPALTPVYVEKYPFGDIAGVSIKNVEISGIGSKIRINNDILFTKKSFSGPVVLNYSKYLNQGDYIKINYIFPDNKELLKNKIDIIKNKKSIKNILHEVTHLPLSFINKILYINNINPDKRIDEVSKKNIAEIFTESKYKIIRLGNYNESMVTNGGVELSEINTLLMSSKKYDSLYFVGEILDVDGDTGGYNLQFAFSSAYMCSKSITGFN